MNGSYWALYGDSSPEQMAQLAASEGAAFDRLFLELDNDAPVGSRLLEFLDDLFLDGDFRGER